MSTRSASRNTSAPTAETGFSPHIAPGVILPEITLKGVVLGLFLAVLFAASTCYLGLKVGRTVAASIPAAVISMTVLRCFRKSNILENNVVQTIASAGEAVAGAAIFTLPALVMLGYTASFSWVETFLLIGGGGLLGVLFSVPLRRSMIVEQKLPYPEGLAAGEVLKAADAASSAGKAGDLVLGTVFGSGVAFLQTGLKVIGESFHAFMFKGGSVFGIAFGFSPILMAAGFITGFRAVVGVGVGAIITWGVGIPLYTWVHGIPEGTDPWTWASGLARGDFRYVAVGTMIVGGVWGVASLVRTVGKAVSASFRALAKGQKGGMSRGPRTERDIPMTWVLAAIVLIFVPSLFFFSGVVKDFNFPLSTPALWWTALGTALFCIVVGFLASSVAAYLTGIVGTTSLPSSGITLSAVLLFALLMVTCLEHVLHFTVNLSWAVQASALTIMAAAVVCSAAVVSGDNMQDLKSGQVVGATPWKQQVALMMGVVASAFVLGFILNVLFKAYGIGNVLPRPDMDPSQALAAPQATLMATVARGVFEQKLDWSMMGLGACIAVVVILADEMLRRKRWGRGYRLPVLSVALGMYLPLAFITPIFLGGFLSFLVSRSVQKKLSPQDLKKTGADGSGPQEQLEKRIILTASGVIAGESVMGILLAIPFALYQSDSILAVSFPGPAWMPELLGFCVVGGMCALIFNAAQKVIAQYKSV